MIVFVVLLALLAVLMAGLFRKVCQQEKDLHHIKGELDGLLAYRKNTSEKIKQQQTMLHDIRYKQDCLEAKNASSSNYEHIDLLSSKGLTESEMVSVCELSRSEIRMISHLQEAKRRIHGTANKNLDHHVR